MGPVQSRIVAIIWHMFRVLCVINIDILHEHLIWEASDRDGLDDLDNLDDLDDLDGLDDSSMDNLTDG
ncbi:MAG: hypothetical protein ABJZ69_17635 [Hyphomicrobiales bacterium]